MNFQADRLLGQDSGHFFLQRLELRTNRQERRPCQGRKPPV
jgi:hypothetical protein